MFNKKPKTAAWFLTIVVAFLAVAPVRAAQNFDPLSEEEKVIYILKNYKETDRKKSEQIDKTLEEIKEEEINWLICLWGDEHREVGFLSGHPEPYYLWLVDKFDPTYDVLDVESKIAVEYVRPFIEKLLDLVFFINRKAYICHEEKGWTAAQIRSMVIGSGLL